MRGSNIFGLDCRFKKWVDHTFDHLQTWTVWKQCLQEHALAPISDTKAPKSRKNHLKIKCATLRDVEVASSNLVTSTKKRMGCYRIPFVFCLRVLKFGLVVVSNNGKFTYPAHRSTSSLVRRRARESRSAEELPCHLDQKESTVLATVFSLCLCGIFGLVVIFFLKRKPPMLFQDSVIPSWG